MTYFRFTYLIFAILVLCHTTLKAAESVKEKSATKNNTIALQKRATLHGSVIDKESGEPIRFVKVKVLNTKFGALTQNDGTYLVRLPAGEYEISWSIIGYEEVRKTITVKNQDSLQVSIALAIQPFLTEEVFVTAERPAERLMRRAIERKMRQQKELKSYSYTLYTKFVGASDTITAGRKVADIDTTIVGIFESYSKGYYREPNDYFNEIFQRRQTENIPPQANFVAFGTNLNAYDDFINLLSEQVATPFHPDALDYYNFEIIGEFRDRKKKRTIYRLKITPSTSQRKLFEGYVDMDTTEAMPLRINIKPSKAVQLPFEAELEYEQMFEEFQDTFVMPTGLHIESTVNAELLWILAPRLDVLIENVAYDYAFNIPLSDDLFQQRRVETNESVNEFDSTYWFDNAIMPLKENEANAYREIEIAMQNPDSVISTTLLAQFARPINNLLRKLAQPPFTGWQDIVMYNRVHGMRLGVGLTGNVSESVEMTGLASYGFADSHVYGDLNLEYFFDKTQNYSASLNLFRRLERRDNPDIVRLATVTTLALFSRNDYGDYFYSDGVSASFSAGFGQLKYIRGQRFERPNQISLTFHNEFHRSASKHTEFAFPGFYADTFRTNPNIFKGTMRSMELEMNFGFNRLRRISDFGVLLRGEFSHPDIGSDFDFRQAEASIFLRTQTLPLWTLEVRAEAGISDGNVPPQRFFSLESVATAIASSSVFRGMKVKEFYGDKYFSLFVQHNFGEVIPGILRIPNLASFGVEFVGFANIGWSDFSLQTLQYSNTQLPFTARTNDKWYYETGLGFNKLLLFFRIDIATRLSQRAKPSFILTFSRATF